MAFEFDQDDLSIEALEEVSGAATASSAGTVSCPATLGTAACW
ncbi:hypothetical protein ABT294_45800 [Nonomuraea sp. NPDC000554]